MDWQIMEGLCQERITESEDVSKCATRPWVKIYSPCSPCFHLPGLHLPLDPHPLDSHGFPNGFHGFPNDHGEVRSMDTSRPRAPPKKDDGVMGGSRIIPPKRGQNTNVKDTNSEEDIRIFGLRWCPVYPFGRDMGDAPHSRTSGGLSNLLM